jgi:hypothetical protein
MLSLHMARRPPMVSFTVSGNATLDLVRNDNSLRGQGLCRCGQLFEIVHFYIEHPSLNGGSYGPYSCRRPL